MPGPCPERGPADYETAKGRSSTFGPRAPRLYQHQSCADGWCRPPGRYNECKDKLMPYLRKCGFNPKTDVAIMPCSGLTGAGLKVPVDPALVPWYRSVRRSTARSCGPDRGVLSN